MGIVNNEQDCAIKCNVNVDDEEITQISPRPFPSQREVSVLVSGTKTAREYCHNNNIMYDGCTFLPMTARAIKKTTEFPFTLRYMVLYLCCETFITISAKFCHDYETLSPFPYHLKADSRLAGDLLLSVFHCDGRCFTVVKLGNRTANSQTKVSLYTLFCKNLHSFGVIFCVNVFKPPPHYP